MRLDVVRKQLLCLERVGWQVSTNLWLKAFLNTLDQDIILLEVLDHFHLGACVGKVLLRRYNFLVVEPACDRLVLLGQSL